MAKSYLDGDGVLYFWQKIKNLFALKTDLSNYALKTDISSVYKYKGTVSTYADLPSSGLVIGDVYNVETADASHGVKAGDNVVWTGSAWDVLSGTVDLSAYATTSAMNTALDGKVDKVTGKGLSANDYTTTEKNKLAGIASGAEVNVQADWNVTDTSSDAYIKNKPTIPEGVTIDSALSSTSTNAVQNKVINTALGNKVDKVSGKGLSTNDYTTAEKTKLTGIAEGAEVNVQADWSVTDTASDAYIANKPTIPAEVPSAQRVFTGVCNTMDTNSKKFKATLYNGTNYANAQGNLVVLRMKYASNQLTTATVVALEVNEKGGAYIYTQGQELRPSMAGETYGWRAGDLVAFLYTDAKWEIVGKNTNTQYSSMTQSTASAGTSTTGSLISAKVLSDTIVEKIGTEMVAITNSEIDTIVAS